MMWRLCAHLGQHKSCVQVLWTRGVLANKGIFDTAVLIWWLSEKGRDVTFLDQVALILVFRWVQTGKV